jgi:hypothetical protein
MLTLMVMMRLLRSDALQERKRKAMEEREQVTKRFNQEHCDDILS